MSNSASLAAAVIGLGGMGTRHADAYEEVEGVELVAASEVKAELAAAFGEKHPDVCVFADAHEMLRAVKPDVLSIAANTPVFEQLTLVAVDAGVRYILCEKPMAPSLAAARRMVDACDAAGVRLSIDHTRRFDARWRRLREVIASGVIGDVSVVMSNMSGALLGCMATHMFDAARMVAGGDYVALVGGLDAPPYRPNPRGDQYHDPGGHAFAYLSNGARVYIDHAQNIGTPARFEVLGTMGWAIVEQRGNSWRVEARQGDERGKNVWDTSARQTPVEFIVPPGSPPPLGAALAELIGDGPLASTGEDGYAALECVVATHLSHERGGARVELPLSGEALDREFTFT